MKEKNDYGYIFEAIFGILTSLIFLYIVNYYYKNISFITSDFTKLIPLYNLSLFTGIIFHIVRVIYRSNIVKKITEIISNIIFVVLAYNLFTIYPFDTTVIGDSDIWNLLFKCLIVLPAFGVSIATLVNILKLFKIESSDTKKITKKS